MHIRQAFIALFLSTSFATSASATFIKVEYKGIALSGLDRTGRFGVDPNVQSIIGLPVEATYFIRTSGGGVQREDTSFSSLVRSGVNSNSPAYGFVDFSINGVSARIRNTVDASASNFIDTDGRKTTAHSIQDININLPIRRFEFISMNVTCSSPCSIFSIPTLDQSFSFLIPTGSFSLGGIEYRSDDGTNPFYDVVGTWEATSVRVTSLDSIPEPTSWLLLTIGFGATGTILRRRHKEFSVHGDSASTS